MPIMSKKTIHILVAPLSWGLGHATRCIPIIREIEKNGMIPFIASDSDALALLKIEFPNLNCIKLPSYNIQYKCENMFLNIASQSYKIIRASISEHSAINNIVSEYQIDAIISDNRYGCYHSKCYNIFISHQLNLKIKPKFMQSVINRFQRKLVSKYNEIWVPDYEKYPGLAGDLSHPQKDFHPKVTYIEPLSRLTFKSSLKIYDIIVVVSGPEPQRTSFENKIMNISYQLTNYKWLIVRGMPLKESKKSNSTNMEIVSHLNAEDFNIAILNSKVYIGRSGYSSIMDISRVGIKSLLIPTPGQTEQEYLATILKDDNFFFTCSQQELNVERVQSFLVQTIVN